MGVRPRLRLCGRRRQALGVLRSKATRLEAQAERCAQEASGPEAKSAKALHAAKSGEALACRAKCAVLRAKRPKPRPTPLSLGAPLPPFQTQYGWSDRAYAVPLGSLAEPRVAFGPPKPWSQVLQRLARSPEVQKADKAATKVLCAPGRAQVRKGIAKAARSGLEYRLDMRARVARVHIARPADLGRVPVWQQGSDGERRCGGPRWPLTECPGVGARFDLSQGNRCLAASRRSVVYPRWAKRGESEAPQQVIGVTRRHYCHLRQALEDPEGAKDVDDLVELLRRCGQRLGVPLDRSVIRFNEGAFQTSKFLHAKLDVEVPP